MLLEKKVSILYGTQTGNSEDVAERIGRQFTRIHCKSSVVCLSDYQVQHMINENIIIFVCSTTGNGEFPDNMKCFWKFILRKDLPTNSLCSVKFCVFGLGDSSYEKFNVVAKKLNKRLLQLGATEILPLALADDQHELGYDAALDPWLSSLKVCLREILHLSNDCISEETPLPSKYEVFFSETTGESEKHLKSAGDFFATLKENTRVTAQNHFQAVHVLKFEIDPAVHYEAGDVAVVLPKNPKEEVDEFLSLLTIPPDTPFTILPRDTDILFPKLPSYPCTVRQCVTSYFDILSVPRRSFFELLYHFSQDELEKEKLLEFTTASGQEELYDYCNRPRRTILEVLKDFPQTSPHIPFEYLFEMIPVIRPRSFSIASSLLAHPGEFHLLVAVVEYKTRLKKERKGLCSNWITKLSVNDIIPFSIKHGSISLPKTGIPIICIGPGTGCAPFRSFFEERSLKQFCSNYLFYGSRYKEKDFLFSEAWEELQKTGLLVLVTAFSRDQENKIYVQHRVKEHEQLLWDLIQNKGAVVYVAGNAKQMPQGVKEAFLEIFEKHLSSNKEDCDKFMQQLETKKRYQTETWA